MNKFLKKTFETCDNEQDNVPSTSNVVKKQKLVKRQYREDYIQYGFSGCANKDAPKPLCIVCGKQLANEAMVPSKLICPLNAKYAVHAHNNTNYFQRMLSQNKKQECYVKLSFTVSEKALEASYHVEKLIARQRKPHTIGESLIKPACLVIVRLMLGPKEVKEVRKVPVCG